jgi:hypothetical protein
MIGFTRTESEILCASSNLLRAALVSGVVMVGLALPASAADTYLAVWASDKETDDNHLDRIFWRSSMRNRDRRTMARS